MKAVSLEELLEAGAHFGHQITRSNPKARDFIFEARDGIHIIDLAKTKEGLEEAGKFVEKLAKDPTSTIIIVGTKRQAHEVLTAELERINKEIKPENKGVYFVTNKWIGGLLTNFSEVSKNFKKLTDFNYKLETPSEQQGFTKKEIGGWAKEKEKLESYYGGVFTLTQKPSALFIIDSHLESTAVKEAMMTGVPSVAITDTNSDPSLVDYPIPANDDAVGSLQLIISYILDAWKEGRNAAGKTEAKPTEASQKPEVAKKKEEVKPKVAKKTAEKKPAAKKAAKAKK